MRNMFSLLIVFRPVYRGGDTRRARALGVRADAAIVWLGEGD